MEELYGTYVKVYRNPELQTTEAPEYVNAIFLEFSQCAPVIQDFVYTTKPCAIILFDSGRVKSVDLEHIEFTMDKVSSDVEAVDLGPADFEGTLKHLRSMPKTMWPGILFGLVEMVSAESILAEGKLRPVVNSILDKLGEK